MVAGNKYLAQHRCYSAARLILLFLQREERLILAMADPIILVENLNEWKPHFPKLPVITTKDYLSKAEYTTAGRNLRIFNFSRTYQHLSTGYYCSLLAETRRHRVLPNIRSLHTLSSQSIYSLSIENLEEPVQQALGKPRPGITTTAFTLDIFFGGCAAKELQELARQVFNILPIPLLQIELHLQDTWRITAVQALHLHSLSAQQEELFITALTNHISRRWRQLRARNHYRYDIALLHNPKEENPPSNSKALQHFIKAGRESGLHVELIESKDYGRLLEFDALFIRETTSIHHYSYQFAKKAESYGLIALDDADSILKCDNRIYVHELLNSHRVRVPKTLLVERDNLEWVDSEIGYPIILKTPDFSTAPGAYKVQDREQLMAMAERLFALSDILLAQEFIAAKFDWRVGMINKTPLFVCQYAITEQQGQMRQIRMPLGRNSSQNATKTLRLHEAPEALVKTALKAANLIGNGFYGVDLKQSDKGIFVMAINDNPYVNQGVEDGALKEQLYQKIMGDFLWRLDRKRGK